MTVTHINLTKSMNFSKQEQQYEFEIERYCCFLTEIINTLLDLAQN
jgi:hypothetical protein